MGAAVTVSMGLRQWRWVGGVGAVMVPGSAPPPAPPATFAAAGEDAVPEGVLETCNDNSKGNSNSKGKGGITLG